MTDKQLDPNNRLQLKPTGENSPKQLLSISCAEAAELAEKYDTQQLSASQLLMLGLHLVDSQNHGRGCPALERPELTEQVRTSHRAVTKPSG